MTNSDRIESIANNISLQTFNRDHCKTVSDVEKMAYSGKYSHRDYEILENRVVQLSRNCDDDNLDKTVGSIRRARRLASMSVERLTPGNTFTETAFLIKEPHIVEVLLYRVLQMMTKRSHHSINKINHINPWFS